MRVLSVIAALMFVPLSACAQEGNKDTEGDKGPLSSDTFKGLELRNIGPALMSGRIADIVIVQDDPATWFVAVGSGGVWKTTNAGTTWTPLFDKESSYSIGAIALDPSNANTVWVGTGENVGGRHTGYGDGIYRSLDGGSSWENLGLENSEHISKIIVHPNDPNTVFVASQGPLWSSGGDRGLYKTTDGGETWNNVLSAGEWTGVTDVMIDPRDPDRIYAATWQHHRTVAAYVGGGPESGVHMSEDGGETWVELTNGIPEGNKGKIGLAVSPQNPDVLYAAIELNRRTGGVWRSENRGASWEKMSDAVGGGTGPHYYTELYASPHKFDRIYMVSNTSQVSEDGGKTWRGINNEYKHVDDHAIAFRADDPDYILFGSDGGLYESYDNEKSWRFIDNLPVTQFYKVAVDDTEPFYLVYGGTQDNNSQGGPSRTDNRHGIRNSDWFITLFADGHQSATEPGNPDIMYAEWQEGNLVRVDRTTGEVIHIQPQAAPDEPTERFNWDAPIVVSAHDPKRIYFASYRLWRSDDRGDSWQALSGDLTRNEDRMQLPIMGRKWSWDAGWDFLAMSQYNTITSIGESPLDENILYIGTDDGIIQSTNDGGATWARTNVGALPGVPATAFVNDIRADLHDADTVYVALDNHKYGDFTPYLLKSTNRGRSWTSIRGDLPDRHLVWRTVQDHVDPELMFAATEFGLFFTVDGGGKWIEFSGGIPTISFRDVTIQRREEDIVAASFGRGFFILDDYTPLRDVDAAALEQEALLFPGRRAWWYMERSPLAFSEGGAQGHSYHRAPNPPFGAVFTYYLKDELKSLAATRQEDEKDRVEEWQDTPFAGFDATELERRELDPEIWLIVRDTDGNVVRRLKGETEKGFHRIAWDLRFPAMDAVGTGPGFPDEDVRGFLAVPGAYTVSLSKTVRGVTTELVSARAFQVERLREGALAGATPRETVAFWERLSTLQRGVTAADQATNHIEEQIEKLQIALGRTRSAPAELDTEWRAIRTELQDIIEMLNGNQAMAEVGQDTPTTIGSRLGRLLIGTSNSTYGPTPSHRQSLDYAEADFEAVRQRINALQQTTIPAFQAKLIESGAPWTPGGLIPAQ
ncbi:MAG: glycosyl hydrolase [Alphaproteobacteria bacterium]|nr:glycosyl hydrolase [Alphaproteobacteria bacterium]